MPTEAAWRTARMIIAKDDGILLAFDQHELAEIIDRGMAAPAVPERIEPDPDEHRYMRCITHGNVLPCLDCGVAERKPEESAEQFCRANHYSYSFVEELLESCRKSEAKCKELEERLATYDQVREREKILSEHVLLAEQECDRLRQALATAEAKGRLEQLLRTKNDRPVDPIYWDAWDVREERKLRAALSAPPK